MCATNRDPLAEVKAQRFREDLYYRLHVIPVEMPSLRSRDDDVLLLAEHFLDHFSKRDGKAFSGLDASAREALLAYSWPGNVRELQNAIQHACAQQRSAADGRCAGTGAPRKPPRQQCRTCRRRQGRWSTCTGASGSGQGGPRTLLPLWKIEKDAITRALEACGGDVQKAAVALEISASTVYRKLQSWQKEGAA